jgi:hypothetical protein
MLVDTSRSRRGAARWWLAALAVTILIACSDGTDPRGVDAASTTTGETDTTTASWPTAGMDLRNSRSATGSPIDADSENDDLAVVWQHDTGGGINGWMAVAGEQLIVPVGAAPPARLVTLELDR